MIRIVVVDDHALFRSGLISLLGEMGEFQVVGEAANGREALEVVRQTKPDIVLMDVNMPVMGGVETVRALKAHESCRIIMLTISKSDEDLLSAISAGADGYLLKNATPEELRKAILQVHHGMGVLSPEVTRQVMTAVASGRMPQQEVGLSAREIEVLSCLARGLTTAQISQELFISENTVKTHVRHILEKLEASNRVEATRKAVQMGLISASEY
ncbi:MAG: response regulator transcription factor [Anaerolineales bacterium]|nr:response regulator transcription factor [Anaerolineales bacterium]MCS7247803.1 response regulator transcription factor [Anaerolineales bacterium]MDW8161613.1 response regulator transcription factor [Anaerolineales bacterium]MDW8446303.1 response regulator transcription factor [Anaerolineales bacterium]